MQPLNIQNRFLLGELSLKENEVLIEFALTGDEGYVFVIRKGGVNRIHRINIHREALEEKVKSFMEPLNTGKPSEFSIKASKELYEILLSQAMKDVKDTERLIIVPDGILGFLPFEALITKEGRDYKDSLYVGDKWTITYSQSATALALTRLLKPSEAKSLFLLWAILYMTNQAPGYIAYKKGDSQQIAAKDVKQYAYRGLTVLPKGKGNGKR